MGLCHLLDLLVLYHHLAPVDLLVRLVLYYPLDLLVLYRRLDLLVLVPQRVEARVGEQGELGGDRR